MSKIQPVGIPIRRKLIDIPENVFQALSIKAAAMGTNLKKYIEELLVQEAEEMDDAEVYKYLAATRPEGKIMLNEQEKDDFMRKHKSRSIPMRIDFSKDFTKALDKLSGKIYESARDAINNVIDANSLDEIQNCKKIETLNSVYRIRIGSKRAFFVLYI